MEYACGNIFIREMRFAKKGDVVDGHSHNFDHTTYCVRGGLLVEKLDKAGEAIASAEVQAAEGMNWILILANVAHRITALEDGSLGHCVYAHRTPQGKVVQEYTGWGPAYT